MNINQLNIHVSAIKKLMNRGPASDDRPFKDSFIAHLLKLNRAVLLKRKFDKNMHLNEMLRQRICVPLEESQFIDCPGCNLPTLDCVFYKSKDKLPPAIISKYGISYTIRTIAGDTLDPVSITNNRYMKYSLTPMKTKGWFISDQHLYVFWPKDKNHGLLELVVADFISENPDDIANLSMCEENVQGNCLDSESMNSFIDADLIEAMYQMTLTQLGYSYKMPQDELGNAADADLQKAQE